jgi:hypothetical protein
MTGLSPAQVQSNVKGRKSELSFVVGLIVRYSSLTGVGFKILYEFSNLTGAHLRHGISILELFLGDVLLIKCNVQLGAYFTRRGARHTQKIDELHISTALETFRDVAHHGNACTTNLIAQTKVTIKAGLCAMGINRIGQLSGSLPSFNVFKASDCSHDLFPDFEYDLRLLTFDGY